MSDIEYFYSAHSAFAYIGSRRLMQIATDADRQIVHKPFDLMRTMQANGVSAFKDRSLAHRAYYFGREVERWSQYREAPLIGRRPTHHDNDMTLANCVLIAANERGSVPNALAHAMLEAHWRNDADLADPLTLTSLLTEAGFDPQPLLHAAESASIQGIYRDNTDEAISRSVFGSPTYFLDGDMFYGQDRLEMLERAIRTPFVGQWPR